MRISDWSSDVCSSDLFSMQHPSIYLTYLNRFDVEELALTDDEILAAIETSLASQGRGEAVIEPRMHLEPGVANGHFNVLRGALREPIDSAGVKVVGDFVDNYKHNLPSRSEEHTSELQSLMRISYAVFCLKKKHRQISD